MATHKEQSTIAKLAKTGIVEQRPPGTKSKRPRLFDIDYRRANAKSERAQIWQRWMSYRTRDEAQMAMESMARKHKSWEWRHSPEQKDEPEPRQ